MEKIIELIDIKKIYNTGNVRYEALKGISFNVKKGGFICIVGPSGSGKTTLLNLIGCLDTPTEGIIYLENMKITNLTSFLLSNIRRKKIGFIFQSFNLLQALTVYENIEMPLLFNGISSPERKKQVEYYMDLVGIGHVAKHRVTDISGGQQQRTAIARALIKKPLLVIADEPTGNLDSETGREIIELVKKINALNAVTFIIATHDPMVIRYADEVINLLDGRIKV